MYFCCKRTLEDVYINHVPRFPMDIKDNGSLVVLTCEIEYELLAVQFNITGPFHHVCLTYSTTSSSDSQCFLKCDFSNIRISDNASSNRLDLCNSYISRDIYW